MNWKFFEILRNHRTRAATRAVGLALAIRAKNDDPSCYPSIRCLCIDASVSLQSAITAIRELEAAGLIEVERKPGKCSVYHLATVLTTRTPTVLRTGTLNGGDDCSSEQNTDPPTVLTSRTLPFQPLEPKGQ